ncbi:MAG TPA: hypothetical protein VMU33_17095 [Burkholderiaceae bacterium]|nr:hypothetical protein [Burkholderiaceae bacterium]
MMRQTLRGIVLAGSLGWLAMASAEDLAPGKFSGTISFPKQRASATLEIKSVDAGKVTGTLVVNVNAKNYPCSFGSHELVGTFADGKLKVRQPADSGGPKGCTASLQLTLQDAHLAGTYEGDFPADFSR